MIRDPTIVHYFILKNDCTTLTGSCKTYCASQSHMSKIHTLYNSYYILIILTIKMYLKIFKPLYSIIQNSQILILSFNFIKHNLK